MTNLSLALQPVNVSYAVMFRIILTALLLGSPLHAVTIAYAEAGKHVGQEVTVTGQVSNVRTIASGMTFVNFGARGAADAFTAVGKPGVVEGKPSELSTARTWRSPAPWSFITAARRSS